jgi:hypothetical protein
LSHQLTIQHSSLATSAGCQTFCACQRRNFWRSLIIMLFLLQSRLLVCGAETALSETNLIPENTRLWTESMLWDEQISLSSGLGYNKQCPVERFQSARQRVFSTMRWI